MTLPNLFTADVSDNVIQRINELKSDTQPSWGKMSVAQMLAHCNVTYELIYEDKHPRPSFLMKLFMQAFVKKLVTNAVPYKRNAQTAPAFRIKDLRDFDLERNRLINFISRTQQLGEDYFDGKEAPAFGILTKDEWNNMFYKHVDHHLQQFGA